MNAFNPFLPSWEYVPDSEPRVFGDRVYTYGSHDLFGSTIYCEGDYVCWSAPVDDLGAWRFEGVIYRRDQEVPEEPSPWKEASSFHPGHDALGYLYAPDCVRGPDGRYYLYYSMSGDTTTSVAVSDVPAGPFAFYGHVRHPDGGRLFGHVPGDVNCFDPAVLVDDDGRIYLYSGFAPKNKKGYDKMARTGLKVDGGYVVELERDMLTLKSEPVMTIPGSYLYHDTGFDGHRFFEASSIRKIGDHYDLIWSSELSHELCHAVSDSPMGPFRWSGTIVSIGDVGLDGRTEPVNYTGNTHGGLARIRGQWYIFYHRHTNGVAFSRQGCAEPVEILADGSIPQVEITSCGLNGGPLPGRGTYDARIACHLTSANGTYDYGMGHRDGHPFITQSMPDRDGNGGQYIADLEDGCTVGFKYFDYQGTRELRLTVRGSFFGKAEVRTSLEGEIMDHVPLLPAEDWAEFVSSFAPKDGKAALYLTFRGVGKLDLKAFAIE